MTFLQAVRQAKTKYHTDNQVVIFTILFKLSKHVKNTLQFTNLRNQPIDFNFQTFCKQLCDYFAKQKPLSQIVGYTKFCHLRIDVFKNIFEPRSETELITEDIIKYLNKHKKMRLGVDLCCGSGCMGITVKKHCPQTNIICVDINPKAILNTKHNAKLNNVKIKTIIGDFYQTLIDKKLKVDFIICNPPYVDKKDLNWKMTKYETEISFTNSEDPLFFYKKIINNKHKILNPQGEIFFENEKGELLIV